MNRRDFLKKIIKGAALAALPIPVVEYVWEEPGVVGEWIPATIENFITPVATQTWATCPTGQLAVYGLGEELRTGYGLLRIEEGSGETDTEDEDHYAGIWTGIPDQGEGPEV